MSIKEIKIKNSLVHKDVNIRFNKGRIATIVGLNGSGKTLILESINKERQENYKGFGSKNITFNYQLSEVDLEEFNNTIETGLEDAKYLKPSIMEENDFEKHFNYLIQYVYEETYKKIKKINKIANFPIPDKLNTVTSFQDTINILSDHQMLRETDWPIVYNWINKINSLIEKYRSLVNIQFVRAEQDVDFKFIVCFNENGSLSPLETINNNGRYIVSIARQLGIELPTLNSDLEKFNKNISDELTRQIGTNNIEAVFSSEWSYNNVYFYLNFFENGEAIDWRGISDGTRRYIEMLLQLGRLNEYTVVLIDEPERGLHPAMQKELRNTLQKIVEDVGCRIIITTHSEYMLNSYSNYVNTYVSHKKGNEFHFSSITDYQHSNGDLEGVQIWNELGISEAESFKSINHDSKIILVEGTSDVIYIKKFLSINNINLNSWRVIPAGGDGKLKYISHFLNEYKNVNKKNILIIADGDIVSKNKKTKKEIEQEFSKYGELIIIDQDCIEDVFSNSSKIKIKFDKKHKNIAAMNFARGKTNLSKDEKTKIEKIAGQIAKKIS